MKCPQCGYENVDGAEFCNLCYNVLKKKAPSAVTAQPAQAARPISPSGSEDSPDAEASDETLKKINQGWVAAMVCAAFTLIAVFVASSVKSLAGLVTPWSFVDAILLFGLAFGIKAKSRAAATIMFIYYVADKLYTWVSTGKPSGIFIVGLFSYYFFQAMVATYDYHRENNS